MWQDRAKKHAFARGLLIYPGGGTADGRAGDHILLAPPYTVTDAELEMIVDLLADTPDVVVTARPATRASTSCSNRCRSGRSPRATVSTRCRIAPASAGPS